MTAPLTPLSEKRLEELHEQINPCFVHSLRIQECGLTTDMTVGEVLALIATARRCDAALVEVERVREQNRSAVKSVRPYFENLNPLKMAALLRGAR